MNTSSMVILSALAVCNWNVVLLQDTLMVVWLMSWKPKMHLLPSLATPCSSVVVVVRIFSKGIAVFFTRMSRSRSFLCQVRPSFAQAMTTRIEVCPQWKRNEDSIPAWPNRWMSLWRSWRIWIYQILKRLMWQCLRTWCVEYKIDGVLEAFFKVEMKGNKKRFKFNWPFHMKQLLRTRRIGFFCHVTFTPL